jgi:hypothetical protein
LSEQIDEDCDECHSQDEDMEDDDPASKMLQGSIDASYQVSVHLTEGFRGED